MGAVWQVVVSGTKQQQAEAAEILAETRRKLYGLLGARGTREELGMTPQAGRAADRRRRSARPRSPRSASTTPPAG